MSNQTTSGRSMIPVIMGLAVVALAVAYWRQVGETRKIRAENEQLRQNMGRSAALSGEQPIEPAQVDVPMEEPAITENAESATRAMEIENNLVLTPTGYAAPPRSDGLSLNSSRVDPVESGIKANLQFTPTITDPLGIIAVVVRLPRNSREKIIELIPAGNMRYAEIAKRVSEDGKFAVFQINADYLEDFEVHLTVSGPVTAEILGTCGIGPYEVQIAADSINTVKK